MKSYPDCDATLTRAEREAPFAISEPDNDPLPARTRMLVVWDGPLWAEIEPQAVEARATCDQEPA